MSADRIHRWANYIVGFNFPRSWLRKLSIYKRGVLCKYINYMWLSANDNTVKRINRPSWCPKKYIWSIFK